MTAYICGHTHHYSRYQYSIEQQEPPEPVGQVWQIDVGSAGVNYNHDRHLGFLDVMVRDHEVQFDMWRGALGADDSLPETWTKQTWTVVDSPPSTRVQNIRVHASEDDAEEDAEPPNLGKVWSLASSDLELVSESYQDRGNQLVGMRFNHVFIPSGATITNAYLQFTVDETTNGYTSLVIEGEATDNALPFTNINFNISSRDKTDSSVNWVPDPWQNVGEAGLRQRTNDLSRFVQEIVDQPGWSSGFSMVMLISGSGQRVAKSYDGDPSSAPLLHIEFTPLQKNLEYSPVTPCRIVDTRNLGPGPPDGDPIPPGGLRSYDVRGAAVSQGGNPDGCPSPQGEPHAVHLNVTAVPVAGAGHLRMFPFNTPTPHASMLSNSTGAGNMANAVSVKTCYYLCTEDVNVQSFVGTTHVVIDVLGYYYPAP